MNDSGEPVHEAPFKADPLQTADVLAEPKRREMLRVSFEAWDRLKTRVERLGNPRVDFVNYVTGALGVCIPCAITFLVELAKKNHSTTILIVYGGVAVAAGVAAIVFRKFQQDERAIREEDATDIVDEMKLIESAFLRGED